MPLGPRSTARAERAEPSFTTLAPRAREPLPVRPAAAPRPPAAASELDTRRTTAAPRLAAEVNRTRTSNDAEMPVLTLKASDRLVMSGGRAGRAEPQRRRGGMLRGLAFAVLLVLAAVGTATVVHAFQGLLGH